MSNQNIYSLFQQYFPADRNKPFLIDEKGVSLSYAELESQSAQLANYLAALGINQGDRVAVQVKKSRFVLPLYLACIRAGFVYLPLNTGYTRAEVSYFITDARPALVIIDPQSLESIQALAEQAGAKLETLSAEGEGTLYRNSAGCEPDFATVVSGSGDLAAILYTSGTTGRPKGAMLSHANLSSNALMLRDYWGWSEQDVLLHALPIFHVHGLFVACHCVLAAGASMLFLPGFNAEQVSDFLPQATVMMGVPTFYTRLLASGSFTAERCENMRLFISGSAPLLEQTHRDFEQRSGFRILERYGMSETGMLVSNPLQGERRAGTVGFPLPQVEVRVVDEQNRAVTAGDVGSIQVKGPNIFKGYWQMPEKTAEEFTEDGFFITGDQGVVSDDGYITIVGRSKDMVISGGYNVYPKEVELVLNQLSGVKESAVIGLSHPDFGEQVVAVIVGEKSLASASIIEQAKLQLANYKVPKQLFFVDELPRNTMGKVQKNLLREQYSSA